jgi:hypothetical protein
MAALSFLYAATVFRNDSHLLSLQYKLKMTSLSTDWIENEHFLLVFMKTSVFMPKTGSINSGKAAKSWLAVASEISPSLRNKFYHY